MAREIPNRLFILLNELFQHASLFLDEYNENIQRMRATLNELQTITAAANRLQNETKQSTAAGLGFGGLGATGALAAAATAGASASLEGRVRGGVALVASITAAGFCFRKAWQANRKKTLEEKDLKNRAKQSGKTFMDLVTRQKNALEDTKRVSDRLNQTSSMLSSKTGEQAEISFSKISEFENLLEFPENVNTIDCIIKLAKQGRTVLEELDKMTGHLKDLDDH